MNLGMYIGQEQKLTINTAIEQSLKVLSLSHSELLDFIKKEKLENPLLSFEQDASSQNSKSFSTTSSGQNLLNTYNGKNYEEFYGVDRPSFRDLLKKELMYLSFNDDELDIAKHIIDNLDETGYFRLDLGDVSNTLGYSKKIIVSVLENLKSLDPPGIFSNGIQESLQIQLKRRNVRNYVAESIVHSYFDELVNSKLKSISIHMNVDILEIQEAIDLIRTLNPTPLQGTSQELPQYIIPDLYLVDNGDVFTVKINESLLPSLKVDDLYLNLLQKDESNTETRQYIKSLLYRIKFIRNCINQRNETLLNIGKFISEYQSGFFKKGALYLRPLTMAKLAEYLSIHESTVSRGIKNKHIQSKSGIYPLKYFFQRALINEDMHTSVSAGHVKHIIDNLISNEIISNPITDTELCEQLRSMGISISRRTVCKYRIQLGYSAAHKRRRY